MPPRRARSTAQNMSAHDMMKAQMDELMGKNRDVAGSMDVEPDFSDPQIDRYFLCGCSPYELLRGTKSEHLPQLEREGFLKERSETVRLRWEALPQEERDGYGYERDLYDLLTNLVEEHDRRISRLRERYERENSEVPEISAEAKREIENKQDESNEMLVEAELLGEEGKPEAQLVAQQKAEALAKEAELLEKKALPPGYKKQFVDDVSGLVYSSTDSEARFADLQKGKQYQAWAAIRAKLTEMREKPPPPRRRDARDRDRDRDDGRGGGYRGGVGYGGGRDRHDDYDSRRGGGRDDYDRGPPPRGRGAEDLYDRRRDYDYDDRRGDDRGGWSRHR